MPKKKTESVLEKTEKKTKKVAKKIVSEIEEIGEKIGEEAKEIVADLEGAEKTKEEKLAKLKEKAAKLASKVESKEIDLVKQVKSEEEKSVDLLVPIEDYLKSSIHLGTRAITPDMRLFVYKRRADSLAVFNTTLVDKKIREAADFIAAYEPNGIIVVCKREAGFTAAEMFGKITGIQVFAKERKYPPGILTNPKLENFMEKELMIICDPWTDKSAMDDAHRVKIPVLAICDTNNYTQGVDFVLPGNNKSSKSLGMVFYLLAKLYTEKKGIKAEIPPIKEWIENWDTLIPPK